MNIGSLALSPRDSFRGFLMNAFRRIVWLFALIAFPGFAISCPFCEAENTPTLVHQFDKAEFVIFGHFENARPSNAGLDQGVTDFVIENVFKEHDAIKGKKRITLPRYITDSKTKFVIYCDIYKGKIDAYKGVPLVSDSEMVRYIDVIRKNKGKSQPERLRDAFDFLNSPETEVAMDAYREFARADYRDYKDIAKKLPADKIAGWLKDPKTSPSRYGLYASLLGHCGTADDAKLLMTMITDPERRKSSGLHGLMSAYTMLEPEKGWTYLTDLVQDKKQPFLVRYAGLQTMRFLYDNRADILNKDETAAKKKIVAGVVCVLNVTDMADFAIEDLRKWHCWDECGQVLGLFAKGKYDTPIIRKSILRYALQCPLDDAKAFCKAQQVRDPEWFNDTRELLELETIPPATK
jgi:hypothetical protein